MTWLPTRDYLLAAFFVSPDSVRDGDFFDVEADFRGWGLWRRWRWIENLHDSLEHLHNDSFVSVQAGLEFGFQRRQFACQRARIGEGGAHFDEGANDEDTHLGSPVTVQNVSGHDGA